jgi:hypothetical protein
MDQAIDTGPETTAVFIGRALRGPLHTPIPLRNAADFRRRFGGSWNHSSLGRAVEQFFEHGGQRLYVVRVANNARGAMICLPAFHGVLVLRAIEPGSTENIRAAVDYDRIDDGNLDRFNLTLQRVTPGTGLVADQEIYQRLSCSTDDKAFIGNALQNSSIARPQTPLPSGRPMPTSSGDSRLDAGYVGAAQPGSDGTDLCDYDLIGSAAKGSGLFSLDQLECFDLLYMPPPARHGDLGPAAVLAAELYCRRRGAMLIMDPPAAWSSGEEAIAGIRQAGYASPNIMAYFPRVRDRRDGAARAQAAGGAVAGLLCRHDRRYGPWQPFQADDLRLNRSYTPAVDIGAKGAARLAREGFNVIAAHDAGHAALGGSVTLARNSEMYARFASLNVRRLCLFLTGAIERATRWAVFEANNVQVAERIHAQVHAYMAWLAETGAFADARFAVRCDAGLHSRPTDPRRGITILLTFQPAGAGETLSLTLHQTVAGCRVAASAFPPSMAQCA